MGQVDTVRLLIKYDYHLVFQSDLEGFKPIHMAIALGYYDISVVLLQTGFVHDPTYVNVKSRTLSTPLMEAILANHVDLVYLLLDYKVDIFATTLVRNKLLLLLFNLVKCTCCYSWVIMH